MNYRGYMLEETPGGILVTFLGQRVQLFPSGEDAQREIDDWLYAP